jgi:hypothetical protein
LISEQVRYVETNTFTKIHQLIVHWPNFICLCSHHPPITASYMWDDEHGIRVGLSEHVCKNFEI